MTISQKLREKNIAEYLLYMWQQEDLLRAFGLDIDRLDADYLSQFQLTDEERQAARQWYADMADMMRDEGVTERGHLQVNKNIVLLLEDLHAQLLRSPKHPFYSAAYYKALPFIVELRAKSHTQQESEIENCFDAMYGLLLLRLQKKTVSKETERAMKAIADFLALLAEYDKKDKRGEVEF